MEKKYKLVKYNGGGWTEIKTVSDPPHFMDTDKYFAEVRAKYGEGLYGLMPKNKYYMIFRSDR